MIEGTNEGTYIYEGNNVLRTFDSKVKIPIFNRRTLACTGGLHSCVRASSSCH